MPGIILSSNQDLFSNIQIPKIQVSVFHTATSTISTCFIDKTPYSQCCHYDRQYDNFVTHV